MISKIILVIFIGAIIGSIMGYYGKCTTGACPLTANPYRGAAYGAFLGLLFALTLNPNAGYKEKQTSKFIFHIENEEAFYNLIQNSKELVIMDFYADWCGACNKLAPVISRIADKYQDKIKICKNNSDKIPQLAIKLSINALPTIVFYKEGKEVKRIVGFHDESAITSIIEDINT
ncbi:MAG: hypothetical protein ACD_79C00645G0001 [uncultured bacterium]|nr:MAG: hypothetical protein ACD_79C00645G0001 [uncultured bacterium]